MVMRVIAVVLALFTTCGPNTAAQAQQSNDCKICRDSLQACL